MSGYPYGSPPPTQPYGGGGYGTPPADTASPTASAPRQRRGRSPPNLTKWATTSPQLLPPPPPTLSQYSGVKPSKTGYQPSAPPAACPYGGYVDPYSAGSEKPSKAQQGGGNGDPYSEKPSKAQKGGGYSDPYSEKPSKAQNDGG